MSEDMQALQREMMKVRSWCQCFGVTCHGIAPLIWFGACAVSAPKAGLVEEMMSEAMAEGEEEVEEEAQEEINKLLMEVGEALYLSCTELSLGPPSPSRGDLKTITRKSLLVFLLFFLFFYVVYLFFFFFFFFCCCCCWAGGSRHAYGSVWRDCQAPGGCGCSCGGLGRCRGGRGRGRRDVGSSGARRCALSSSRCEIAFALSVYFWGCPSYESFH